MLSVSGDGYGLGDITVYVIVRVYVSLSSRLRARGLLMVNTMNKYTLNSLVSDLFCDIQRM